jgi:hypothetical protein
MSASDDAASVADSNEDAFRAMAQSDTSDDDFEEADIDVEMQRRRQRGRGGAKKTAEEQKIAKAVTSIGLTAQWVTPIRLKTAAWCYR